MNVTSNSLSSELVYYITSNQENLNLQTLLGTTKYQSSINKKIIIDSGITVGATNTSNYALNIPSGFGGRIILVNNGSIQGAGGAANGGTGGNAIFAGASNIFIDNRGTIYSGGGGGGQGGTGGTGGQGFYNYDCSYTALLGASGCFFTTIPDTLCTNSFGGGAYCNGGNASLQNCPPLLTQFRCVDCRRFVSQTCTAYTSGGGGGAGGAGGRGRGYDYQVPNSLAGSGGAGGSAGGTNAGTGGTGGTGGSGGDWGTSGNTGNTGNTGANGNYTAGSGGSAGSSGGLAGFYIVNNANITWLANGTLAGRVG